MTIKRLAGSIVLFTWLVIQAPGADARETCYIDNSPLFLYKTINWWYDSPPQESDKLCGRPVRCKNQGEARASYDEPGKRIELNFKDGFAGMLSVFKACRQCYGPSFLRESWLDQKYFQGTAATVVLDAASTIQGLAIDHVDKEQARLILSMAHDLQFVLEGVIGGLANGRIALHASGNLLKKCRQASHGPDDSYPISLKIINGETGETIAKFDMVWIH